MSTEFKSLDADDGRFHEVAKGTAGAAQKKTWLGYLWDTADLAKDERRLLFKIDASLLIFASVGFQSCWISLLLPMAHRVVVISEQLGYFLKNLDQTNVNNAVRFSAVSVPVVYADRWLDWNSVFEWNERRSVS